jgi:A/G-specific adenine glycosylase
MGTVARVISPGPEVSAFRPRAIVSRTLAWYAEHARDLPWRRPGVSPWAVLVSEFMLQQTPVERVRGPWAAWLERWPSPDALAAAPAGEAVRAWGRLGYPRRALRLHQTAVMITERFDGEVPADRASLLSLPGVGSYTAAAIASFAYGRRAVVLDTNVRRVISRVALGTAQPGNSPSRLELTMAERLAPQNPARAARWAVASMELGAMVCVARTPRCAECPVRDLCAWRRAGAPAWAGPPRRGQAYAGTDRQARGALLAVLRSADEPVSAEELAAAWADPAQGERALASLIDDGLVVPAGAHHYALPT